jgi:universal stress protein A
MNYQHIMASIDFSAQSQYIAQKAKNLATVYGAKLSLIHILDNIPMPQVPYGTVISLTEKTENEYLEAEKQKFIRMAEQLEVMDDCRWLVWGNPKQEITHIADQNNVDVIVMGSHGRHGLALLLGSTANAVLHHAHCDVLAVRINED